jgi:uncharacterized protein
MLAGTLAWSWAWLGLAALTGRSWLAFPTVLLTLTGLLGVIAVPALLLWCGYGEESVRAFYRRCFDPRTLPWRWYAGLAGLLLVFGLVPAILAHGTSGLVPAVGGPVIFLLFGLVAGALEEPAWRGYAQEGLQRRMPVVAASLVIGAVWSAWHLPLFLLEGTYQYDLGIGTAGFWAFQAGPVVLAVVYGWLYNAAGRVAFAAVAFHGLGNLMRELWDAEAPLVALGVEAALAVVLVVAGWRWLRRPAPRVGYRIRTRTTAEPD